jgi:predicted MFS family arabinose efflux permease
VIYAVVYVGFALADAPWEISPLFALYGLFFAATDGVLKAWVADHVEGPLAGTAYGIYAGLVGAALLLASALGGVLWTSVGREATFWAGAAFAVASLPLVAIASGIGRPPRSR